MNSSLLWIWTCGDMDAFTYFIDTVTVQVNFEVSEGTIITDCEYLDSYDKYLY